MTNALDRLLLKKGTTIGPSEVAALEKAAASVAVPVAAAAAATPALVVETRAEPVAAEVPAPAEPEQPSLVDEAGDEPSRPVKRKRASVPSWDEIMFGGGKQE